MSLSDLFKKKVETSQEEKYYAALISKMIQIAYFHRNVPPETDVLGKKLMETVPELAKISQKFNMPLTKIQGIPVSLHPEQLQEYLEWLFTLPPYQATATPLGYKLNGPAINPMGIVIPRLSDIFLTLSMVILTPRTIPSDEDLEAYIKKANTTSAKNYVRYLMKKNKTASRISFGPAINDWVSFYYLNYFAVYHVLSQYGKIPKE